MRDTALDPLRHQLRADAQIRREVIASPHTGNDDPRARLNHVHSVQKAFACTVRGPAPNDPGEEILHDLSLLRSYAGECVRDDATLIGHSPRTDPDGIIRVPWFNSPRLTFLCAKR